jgi:hypothetical protein
VAGDVHINEMRGGEVVPLSLSEHGARRTGTAWMD